MTDNKFEVDQLKKLLAHSLQVFVLQLLILVGLQ